MYTHTFAQSQHVCTHRKIDRCMHTHTYLDAFLMGSGREFGLSDIAAHFSKMLLEFCRTRLDTCSEYIHSQKNRQAWRVGGGAGVQGETII
jgi:hypothetical protein